MMSESPKRNKSDDPSGVSTGNSHTQTSPAAIPSTATNAQWGSLPGRREQKKPKRSRLSPQADAITFAFLLDRQNGKCYAQGCEERPTQIHHVDNDSRNWAPPNLRASCLNHNPRSLPAENAKHKEKKNFSERPDRETGYAPIDLNREYEPAYSRWLYKRVIKRKPLYTDEAIYGGAEEVGCSHQTTRGYLNKKTSPEGIYTLVRVAVFVNGKKRWKHQVVFKSPRDAEKAFEELEQYESAETA